MKYKLWLLCAGTILIIFYSCRSEESVSKKRVLQERAVYDRLFEEAESLLKSGLVKDKKWVNAIYAKYNNKFKLDQVVNVTFIKDAIFVETIDAILYKFDKESGEIKWVTQLGSPSKNPRLFYDKEREVTINQYERLIEYYTDCISNVEKCAREQRRKKEKEEEAGKERVINIELQKKIFESRKFDMEQKLLNLKDSFLIYTLRELKLVGIDYYSGAVKFTKFLPSLPATQPFFFGGFITYFSSDRNRFVWVDPFELTEESQIIIDSMPIFVKEVGAHILIQDNKSVKYFDSNKIYWSIELNSQIMDAVGITNNRAFLLTADNELLFISLITGRVEWKLPLKEKIIKLFKYAGYLFLKGPNYYYFINLKTIYKSISKGVSYYSVNVMKVLRNVKRFCFGNKDFLYFLRQDNSIIKVKTSTLEIVENFRGFSEYAFIWEFGTNDILLFKKPSFLYYFTFAE